MLCRCVVNICEEATPRVVEEEIDAAESLDGRIDCMLERCTVRDVAGYGKRSGADARSLLRDPEQTVGAAGKEDDAYAATRQFQCNGASNPTRCSSDKRNAVGVDHVRVRKSTPGASMRIITHGGAIHQRRNIRMTFKMCIGLALSMRFLASCADTEQIGKGQDATEATKRGDSATPLAASTMSSTDTAEGAQGEGRRYAIRSAEIVMTSRTQVGEAMTVTTVFDRYGALERTQQNIVAEVQGKRLEISNVTVIRDGWAVLYDPRKKIGTRSPATTGFLSNLPDFASLDSSARMGMQYRQLDTRLITGRKCVGHAFVRDGLTIRVWLWKGVPLRSEVDLQPGNSIVSEATSIKTDLDLPDSMFVVPSDIDVHTVGVGK